MKREKFPDSQVIRTGFYSCSESSCAELFGTDTDFRHQTGLAGRDSGGEFFRPVRKKIRVIQKALKKADHVRIQSKKKSQTQSKGRKARI